MHRHPPGGAVALTTDVFSFAIDYYIAVFVAAVGVIQVAASLGQLKGLLFFRAAVLARPFGLGLAVTAAVWFFSSASRNINDYEGGLDANEQAVLLLLGTLSGLAFSLLVSSLVNLKMKATNLAPGDGLEALKETGYVRAATSSVRYWSREWRTQIKSYLVG